MKITFLALLLMFTATVWSDEILTHWPKPLSTEEMELYKQKQNIVAEIKNRIEAKEEYIFNNTLNQLYDIGQAEPKRSSSFAWQLRLYAFIEVLGFIDHYHDENFDFSRPVPINFKGPLIVLEDGRRYRPASPNEIKDPQARADYIKKTKEIKAYDKQYRFEYNLKRGKENWLRAFHDSINGKISNKTKNAVDREQAQIVYEIIRTANAPEKTKQKLRFWLTMMVECDKSLVKKAREENDQTCANYVKELHGDSSVGDSSVGQ